jgi:hypothetical protein
VNGKPIHKCFTNKWTSADSYDFQNEIGTNADSMAVRMDERDSHRGIRRQVDFEIIRLL